MKQQFNQQAAIWTFVAVTVVYVISVGISRFGGDKELPFLGMLMYWVLGLFACIFSGLMIKKEKRKKIINHN